VPDRLFWAHDEVPDETSADAGDSPDSTLDADHFPLDTTRH